jgi:outer membrane lipoprotein-sorting protein
MRLIRRGNLHDVGGTQPAGDEITRLWLAPPSRWRSEFDTPHGRVINIMRDGVWWSSHVRETWPLHGWRAQFDQTLKRVGSRLRGTPILVGGRPLQPFATLFWPTPLLDEFSWIAVSEGSWDGRSVSVLRCKSAGGLDNTPLPVGADEYEIWLDEERGVLLRAAARSGSTEIATIELFDVDFDVRIDDAVFTAPTMAGVGG